MSSINPLQKKMIAALIEDGITISDMIAVYAERQDDLQKEMIERAEPPCEDVEIDYPTLTSAENAREIEAGEGTYVLAWVWVPLDEDGGE